MFFGIPIKTHRLRPYEPSLRHLSYDNLGEDPSGQEDNSLTKPATSLLIDEMITEAMTSRASRS